LGGSQKIIQVSPNRLSAPGALTLDSKGNIFVTDYGDKTNICHIHKWLSRRFAGTGLVEDNENVPGKSAMFNGPDGIVLNEING
jgi:hypothetical protein